VPDVVVAPDPSPGRAQELFLRLRKYRRNLAR